VTIEIKCNPTSNYQNNKHLSYSSLKFCLRQEVFGEAFVKQQQPHCIHCSWRWAC